MRWSLGRGHRYPGDHSSEGKQGHSWDRARPHQHLLGTGRMGFAPRRNVGQGFTPKEDAGWDLHPRSGAGQGFTPSRLLQLHSPACWDHPGNAGPARWPPPRPACPRWSGSPARPSVSGSTASPWGLPKGHPGQGRDKGPPWTRATPGQGPGSHHSQGPSRSAPPAHTSRRRRCPRPSRLPSLEHGPGHIRMEPQARTPTWRPPPHPRGHFFLPSPVLPCLCRTPHVPRSPHPSPHSRPYSGGKKCRFRSSSRSILMGLRRSSGSAGGARRGRV